MTAPRTGPDRAAAPATCPARLPRRPPGSARTTAPASASTSYSALRARRTPARRRRAGAAATKRPHPSLAAYRQNHPRERGPAVSPLPRPHGRPSALVVHATSGRRDPFAAGPARHGDRADRGQRAAGPDRELVDQAGRASPHVQELTLSGSRVHGARGRSRVAKRGQPAGPPDAVPGDRPASRVGRVEVLAVPDDPAGRLLPGVG